MSISTELSERVTEGTQYNKTPEEENQILRARLVDIIRKMLFAKPAAPQNAWLRVDQARAAA